MSPKEYNAQSMLGMSDYNELIKRMTMTFGSVESDSVPFSRQKGVAVREILDNGLDELRAGFGEHIKLSFFEDRSFEVYDSGRGIPVDMGIDRDTKEEASGIFLGLGRMRSGGKFSTDSNSYSSGLHGLGGSAAIATARCAIVTVYRNNKEYQLHFKDWTPGFFADSTDPDSTFTPAEKLSELLVSDDNRSKEEKENFTTGTRIRMWFNDDVFTSQKPYDSRDVVRRLRDTALLVPNIYAHIYDEQNPVVNADTGKETPYSETFHFPDGIRDLTELTQPDEPLIETVVLEDIAEYVEKNAMVLQDDDSVKRMPVTRRVPIRLAFSYGSGYEYTLSSYVNTIRTKLGGVHEEGFEQAFVKAFNNRITHMRGVLKANEKAPSKDDYQEGLTVVLSVEISEPHFDQQSKDSISGGDVKTAIRLHVEKMLEEWIKSHNDEVTVIANKVVAASRTRQRQERRRDLKRAENEVKKNTSLPPKLSDCRNAGGKNSELYICEGDSAKTSLKDARNGKIHAILPIRGKILNVYTSTLKKALENTEIQDIIRTLGAGMGDDFDLSKLRYERIIIATDADPDGGHIKGLLVLLFWKFFRPIVENGLLYSINTPLFVIDTEEKNSRRLYAMNEEQRVEITEDLKENKVKYKTTRLKGLGEVPDEILEESAFDPNKRILTQLLLTDESIVELEENIDLISNEKRADDRRQWIIDSTNSFEMDA